MVTSDTRVKDSNPPTENGLTRDSPREIWMPSSTRPRHIKKGVFIPMSCPKTTTSSTAKQSREIDRHAATYGLPHGLPEGLLAMKLKQRWRNGITVVQRSESDAPKTHPWPGATPCFRAFCAPKRLGAFGGRSRPFGTIHEGRSRVFVALSANKICSAIENKFCYRGRNTA